MFDAAYGKHRDYTRSEHETQALNQKWSALEARKAETEEAIRMEDIPFPSEGVLRYQRTRAMVDGELEKFFKRLILRCHWH